MWRISTGVSAIGSSLPSVESSEERVEPALDREEDKHRHDRREVERSELRHDATEEAQVRVAHVVEESLDPVEPRRARQRDPGGQDVDEDDQGVDVDEDVHEAPHRVDGVEEQTHYGDLCAHQREVRPGVAASYAWLKKPPRSSRRARSSAETSTFRGVSRKTLSATRCMPPFKAYVRPLEKSISRFDSSWSAPCRLRMTGTPSLNLSAICWASLKLRGRTRWTRTALGALSTPRRRGGARRTAVRSSGSGSGSVQSSNSRRRRGASRRTFGRSAYVRSSSSFAR